MNGIVVRRKPPDVRIFIHVALLAALPLAILDATRKLHLIRNAIGSPSACIRFRHIGINILQAVITLTTHHRDSGV